MASSIHPLRELYFRLNCELVEEDETQIRNLLTGIQIPKRDMEKLKDAAAIFLYLEERGYIGMNNLSFLKDLLQRINRKPLIQIVEECEVKLKTYAGTSQVTRPLENGSHYTDVVYRCHHRLQETYQKWSNITPFSWCDGTERLKLEDVYTELELQTKDGKKTKIAKADIFSPRDDCFTPRRVLIEGDTGCGKTTFCKKLAIDWASEENVLFDRFKLLFFLELRDLFEYHRDKQCLIDVISYLYLDFCDQDKADLWTYIQSNQSEVCIVFDGLDEVPVHCLPKYFKEIVREKFSMLKNSAVVVTYRKVRDKNSKQSYDTQLCIKGLDEVALEDFVQKHRRVAHTNYDPESFKISHFLDLFDLLHVKPDKYILRDLSKFPLMALMLWDILTETESLLEPKTDFYTVSSIVDMLVKWHFHKGDLCEDEIAEESTRIKHCLSEIAFNCLQKYTNTLNNEDISNHANVLKAGLLTIESKPFLSDYPRYKFIHTTFQEYFAARHVTNLCDNNPLKFSKIIEQYWRTGNMTFLKFLAGALGDNVNRLFEAFCGSDCFQEQNSYVDILDDESDEYWHFGCISDKLFDILFESGTKQKESFYACVALLPKTLILNVDKISKYEPMKWVALANIISESIMRFDAVILQKTGRTEENNYATFRELMPKKLDKLDIKRMSNTKSNSEAYLFMSKNKTDAIFLLYLYNSIQLLRHNMNIIVHSGERRK